MCFIIGKKLTHGHYRTGTIKKFKNLAIQGVLIRGILEVGFSCFSERVFSFVSADGGALQSSQGALFPQMRKGLAALASGRPTGSSDRRGLVCWNECRSLMADLMSLRFL